AAPGGRHAGAERAGANVEVVLGLSLGEQIAYADLEVGQHRRAGEDVVSAIGPLDVARLCGDHHPRPWKDVPYQPHTRLKPVSRLGPDVRGTLRRRDYLDDEVRDDIQVGFRQPAVG